MDSRAQGQIAQAPASMPNGASNVDNVVSDDVHDVHYPPTTRDAAAPHGSNDQPNGHGFDTPASKDKAFEASLPPAKTLWSYMADHPEKSVAQAMAHLYPKSKGFSRFMGRFGGKHSAIKGLSEQELARLEARGPEIRRRAGWKLPGEEGEGAEISPLFWKIYLSILPTVERDPLSGITSPDLLGSTTTMPLSIISLIPDIMKHYRDVIVRAQTEIFLATNYWQ